MASADGAGARVAPDRAAAGRAPLFLLLCARAGCRTLGADREETLGDRYLEAGRSCGSVVEVGQGHAWQRLPDRALDCPHVARFLGRGERERIPRTLRPGGASDAVDVILGRGRNVKVYDMA